MMIRHKNTTLVKTYALCWVSLQLRWWFSSFLFWTLGKGSHVTVELDMGHLCFLWTLRREKGCWSTSAECPKQFGVSMPMDAIDRSGFGILIVIFWWAGKISDLDLFYRVFKLIFDWGHQAATGEVCKAIIWISHWYAMQPSVFRGFDADGWLHGWFWHGDSLSSLQFIFISWACKWVRNSLSFGHQITGRNHEAFPAQ